MLFLCLFSKEYRSHLVGAKFGIEKRSLWYSSCQFLFLCPLRWKVRWYKSSTPSGERVGPQGQGMIRKRKLFEVRSAWSRGGVRVVFLPMCSLLHIVHRRSYLVCAPWLFWHSYFFYKILFIVLTLGIISIISRESLAGTGVASSPLC